MGQFLCACVSVLSSTCKTSPASPLACYLHILLYLLGIWSIATAVEWPSPLSLSHAGHAGCRTAWHRTTPVAVSVSHHLLENYLFFACFPIDHAAGDQHSLESVHCSFHFPLTFFTTDISILAAKMERSNRKQPFFCNVFNLWHEVKI